MKQTPQTKITILLTLLLVLATTTNATATTYYFNSSGGDDANDCTTPVTACKTINKSINLAITAGDSILFACNETWRLPTDNYLNFTNGTPSGYITYSNYGTPCTNIPIFLGSIEADNTQNWTQVATNIWNLSTLTYPMPSIGNIIFNNSFTGRMNHSTVGTWENLTQQGDWFYNTTSNNTFIYSVGNPASVYSDIELALNKDMIPIAKSGSNRTYISFNGFELKYGARHGINIRNGVNVTIFNNRLSYIGGGGSPNRIGNAIDLEFKQWNISIHHNNITQIADTGIAIEESSSNSNEIIHGVSIYNNIISYTLYGFEYYFFNANGNASDISFTHNTVLHSGQNWEINQRSDGYYILTGGRHLRISASPLNTTRISIKNNILFNSTARNVDMSTTNWNASVPNLDYNLYTTNPIKGIGIGIMEPYQFNGSVFLNLTSFYQNSTMEQHGIESDPLFTDLANGDFRPRYNSPACGMADDGGDVGALPCPPGVTEVGILPGCNTADGCFAYANYTSPDGNQQASGTFKLYHRINSTGLWEVFTGNLSQSLLLPFDQTTTSTDYLIPNQSVNQEYITGKFGSAINLYNNETQILNYNIFDRINSGNYSIGFWYKLNVNESQLDSLDRLFEIWYNKTFNFAGTQRMYLYESSGVVTFAESLLNGTSYTSVSERAPKILTENGSWQHVMITFTNTTNISNIYLNGKLEGTSYYPSLNSFTINNSLMIGTKTASTNFGNTSFDDFVIYKRELTANEIKSIYQSSMPIKQNQEYLNDLGINLLNNDLLVYEVTLIDNNSISSEPTNSSFFTIHDPNASISIDFSTVLRTSNMDYGTGIGSQWLHEHFINYTNVQSYAKLAGPKYFRIFIEKGVTTPFSNRVPIQMDGTYNYTNLSKLINVTLYNGLTPIITFANGAPILVNGTNKNYPPNGSNMTLYYSYFGNVTKYYYDVCSNGTWQSSYGYSCDATNWYWEPWNEPDQSTIAGWFAPQFQYITLFNNASSIIHSINPNMKICGWSWGYQHLPGVNITMNYYFEKFLNECPNIDCISLHRYSGFDNRLTLNNIWYFDEIQNNYQTSPNKVYELLNTYGHPSTKIITTEYNFNASIDHHQQIINSYQSAFISTILSKSVNSNVSGMVYFNLIDAFGTASQSYGLLNSSDYPNFNPNSVGPTYTNLKLFAQLVPFGSSIVQSSSSDESVEVLGVITNATTRGIVLINKNNATITTTITYSGFVIDGSWINANNSATEYLPATENVYRPSSGSLNIALNPYEVMFLRGEELETTTSENTCNSGIQGLGNIIARGMLGVVIGLVIVIYLMSQMMKSGSQIDIVQLVMYFVIIVIIVSVGGGAIQSACP